ncbi:YIP1 family protein [Candidatus Zixiibacteriota bacterium]
MESMDNNAVEVKAEPKGLALKGIYEVFYKPSELFQSLKDNPKILVPYIILVIILSIQMFLLSDLIVEMQLNSPEMQEQFQGQTPPPQVVNMMKYSVLIGGILAFTLLPLITAALALFFGNFVMGGQAKFSQLLSVMLYSGIIYMVGGLIVAPMMLAKGTMMVSLSFAILAAGQGFESFAYTALSKIGLFYIWEFIVAGIGLSIIYNFKRNKGYILSVLSVGLMSIIHVIIALVKEML